MKPTATERLSGAIAALLTRICNYRQKIIDSNLRFGLCIVNPKSLPFEPPTTELHQEFKKRAAAHFNSLGVLGVYVQYWTPPALPTKERNLNSPATVEDYQLTFVMPEFDVKWDLTFIARRLIYCPSDGELWLDEWYERQHESVRLTPLLYETLRRARVIGKLRCYLRQQALPIFEDFGYKYAQQDRYFSDGVKKEKENWKKRYPFTVNFINPKLRLEEAYRLAQMKIKTSRNSITKSFLNHFIKSIEQKIMAAELSEEEKEDLIHSLRNPNSETSGSEKYKAKRPTLSISDIECSQFLYFLIDKLKGMPKNHKVLAQVILFIWLSQHAAHSEVDLDVQDILSTKVTEFRFQELTVTISDKEINVTGGLAEILNAWLGPKSRENQRLLLPDLDYDTLEKAIKKYSIECFGLEGRLQPRDFLIKTHVIPHGRITVETRQQLSAQESLAQKSPYRIDTGVIKKQIQQAFQKNNS